MAATVQTVLRLVTAVLTDTTAELVQEGREEVREPQAKVLPRESLANRQAHSTQAVAAVGRACLPGTSALAVLAAVVTAVSPVLRTRAAVLVRMAASAVLVS